MNARPRTPCWPSRWPCPADRATTHQVLTGSCSRTAPIPNDDTFRESQHALAEAARATMRARYREGGGRVAGRAVRAATRPPKRAQAEERPGGGDGCTGLNHHGGSQDA